MNLFQNLIPDPNKKSNNLQKNSLLLNHIKSTVNQIQIGNLKQNIAQIQEQWNLQKIDKKSQTYSDLKYYLTQILQYPNRKLAQTHRISNKLGKLDTIDTQQQLNKQINNQTAQNVNQNQYHIQCCPCCGFKKQQQQLKICSDKFSDVPVIGISTYLYFKAIKNIIYLLLISLIIYGVYAFVTNIIVSDDLSHNQFKFSLLKTYLDILKISLGSKIYLNNEYLNIVTAQAWLGCAFVFCFIIFFMILERYQQKGAQKIQKLCKSAADYSLILKGIPADNNLDTNVDHTQKIKIQLQKIFNQIFQNASQYNSDIKQNPQNYKLIKINIGKSIHLETIKNQGYQNHIQQMNQNYFQYLKQVIQWIGQLKIAHQFITPNHIRKKRVQAMKNLKQSLQNKKKEYVNYIIEEYKKQKQKQLTTDCFVTFSSKKAKNIILKSVQYSPFDNFLMYLTLFIYSKSTEIQIGGKYYKVKIQNASQPQDINWSNIGISTQSLIIKKLITFLLTLLILCISLAVVYGLSTVQIQNQNNSYISILISIFISVFNVMIIFILRQFTIYENNLTQTDFQSSLAIKSILVQLLNTIIIPIIINVFIKPKQPNQNIYQKNGLSQNIFLLGITNAFISPLFKIIDFYYIYVRYIQPWFFDTPEKKFYMNQIQLNKYYQLIQFQNGVQYIYIITLYLFTCFFMSLQPIIILFSIVGIFLHYWASKYSLFSRCKRPVPGTKILYDTTVQFVYLGGLFYALGSLTFINLLPDDIIKSSNQSAFIANLVAIGLGTVTMLIPFSWIYNLFCSQSQQLMENQLYYQNRIFFPSEYDRLNPSTSHKAIKQYLQYIDKMKEKISNDKNIRNKIIGQLRVASNTNYNIVHSYNNFNPLNILSTNSFHSNVNFRNNQFYNPKIQIIHPKLIYNHLFTAKVRNNENNQNLVNKEQQNNINMKIAEQFNWLTLSNQMHNKQKQNQNSQQNLYQKQNYHIAFTGIQLIKQQQIKPENIILKKTQSQTINIMQILAYNIKYNGHDPIKKPMNYATSPYNSQQLEAFKYMGSDMIKRSSKKYYDYNKNYNIGE